MALAAVRKRLIALAAFASMCAGSVSAAPASLPAALDQARIHANYTDGEFDKVIKELEAFVRSRRACTQAESVFVEKHLSVVYAAHPGTRELGRYHMYRLLDLAPGSDLLDMFVGEEVGGVFDKVGKEYAIRNPSRIAAQKPAPAGSGAKSHYAPASSPAKVSATAPAKAAAPPKTTASAASAPTTSVSYRLPTPRPSPAAIPKDSSARPAWKEPGLWIGGGAAFAVVAFTLFYSGAENAPAGKTYVVPATAAR